MQVSLDGMACVRQRPNSRRTSLRCPELTQSLSYYWAGSWNGIVSEHFWPGRRDGLLFNQINQCNLQFRAEKKWRFNGNIGAPPVTVYLAHTVAKLVGAPGITFHSPAYHQLQMSRATSQSPSPADRLCLSALPTACSCRWLANGCKRGKKREIDNSRGHRNFRNSKVSWIPRTLLTRAWPGGGGVLTPPPSRIFAIAQKRTALSTWNLAGLLIQQFDIVREFFFEIRRNFLRYGRFCDVTTRHFLVENWPNFAGLWEDAVFNENANGKHQKT